MDRLLLPQFFDGAQERVKSLRQAVAGLRRELPLCDEAQRQCHGLHDPRPLQELGLGRIEVRKDARHLVRNDVQRGGVGLLAVLLVGRLHFLNSNEGAQREAAALLEDHDLPCLIHRPHSLMHVPAVSFEATEHTLVVLTRWA